MTSTIEGELRLMNAVLADAVEVLRRGARLGRMTKLYRETIDWIEDDDRTSVVSFVNVCEILGLDPDRVRERLRRWIR